MSRRPFTYPTLTHLKLPRQGTQSFTTARNSSRFQIQEATRTSIDGEDTNLIQPRSSPHSFSTKQNILVGRGSNESNRSEEDKIAQDGKEKLHEQPEGGVPERPVCVNYLRLHLPHRHYFPDRINSKISRRPLPNPFCEPPPRVLLFRQRGVSRTTVTC